jgi:hypothetical protein
MIRINLEQSIQHGDVLVQYWHYSVNHGESMQDYTSLCHLGDRSDEPEILDSAGNDITEGPAYQAIMLAIWGDGPTEDGECKYYDDEKAIADAWASHLAQGQYQEYPKKGGTNQ